jgi:hypothetical protein
MLNFNQGTLTEGVVSVPLSSSLGWLVFVTKKIMFAISKAVDLN